MEANNSLGGDMQIPKITSEMLSKQPDQTVNVINRLIDEVNELTRNKK